MNAGSSLGLESAPTGFIRDLGCINVFGGRWTLHRGAQLCPDDNIDAQQKPGVMAWYNMNRVLHNILRGQRMKRVMSMHASTRG
jgi:hypothetical protein